MDEAELRRRIGELLRMDQPGAGRGQIMAFPGGASATPPRIDRPAPLPGQPTDDALEGLGLARDEVARLAAADAIALDGE